MVINKTYNLKIKSLALDNMNGTKNSILTIGTEDNTYAVQYLITS